MTRRLTTLLALALPVMLAAALAWLWAWATGIDAMRRDADSEIALAVARIETPLAKFKELPRVLADTGPFAETLAARDELSIEASNRLLERLVSVTGASDIYLIDTDGVTVAASNWNEPRSFVGQNFSYRPYFSRAMEGALGRFYAIGTTSKLRGFYFAVPVDVQGTRLGVLTVKVDVDELEAEALTGERDVFFTDPHGVVFLASSPGLLYRTLEPLPPDALDAIRQNRQYDGAEILTLPKLPARSVAGRETVDGTAWASEGVATGEAILTRLDLPRLDLIAHMLTPVEPVAAQARTVAAIAALASLVIALVIALLIQRRRRLAERLAIQARARAGLEARVAERTAALTRTNRQLSAEIADRRAAEAALRQAQDDLIQASKLSALGQMSAGISHELNQPLAAIRSFAENAQVLISRARTDEAAANLGRIAELTSRMARIISNLRAFARREGEPATEVALDRIVTDALELMERRLAAEGARVDWHPPEAPVIVRGGQVRLGQVVMNLVANALDAMTGTSERCIEIRAEPTPEGGRLTLRDTGPGLSEEARRNLFDPFWTTKSVGEGLGLGLSISFGIVESFGGRIRATNHPDGGAVFTIDLPGVHVEAAE
ncbi:sensor histidine kinase [Limibaculum sp. M0105]|uniref:C4-dicarboxylate transport sensor protein DctB n=1 Tax=Thermohalobaculum xanthum TaxID=2753746 RepID=A0A8J7SEL6_9RHOB|nr:ATP-binding protein [Thermohalobaculum xanthum]MBK0400742.1 sensor histidine kinase [Thermohalobaculum xanthum]